MRLTLLPLALTLLAAPTLDAQRVAAAADSGRHATAVGETPGRDAVTPDPALPPARTFHDRRSRLTFQVPAGWNLTRKDHEASTFHLDARSAPRSTSMRALASINFNPYPDSTFSGAFFYLSLVPRLPMRACSHQAATIGSTQTQIASLPFTHGHDEHGGVCTEARDEIYTAPHNGSCLRFDLVINTFCGGDVSGVRDITPAQLESIRHRLEAILDTVRLDGTVHDDGTVRHAGPVQNDGTVRPNN